MKDLASHIMDIVQNSVRANAQNIEITVEEHWSDDLLTITVKDDGDGMDEETLQRVRDPFFTSRTVRKVGLGIPLFQQNAERTGGSLSITSQQGKGTIVEARFMHSHIDRPPLGNMAETISLLIAANPEREFLYTHCSDRGTFSIDTRQLKNMLEGIPVNHPEIIMGIQEMIKENEKEITE